MAPVHTRLPISFAAALLCACPVPPAPADSGQPVEDAGFDGGVDGGRPAYDAGFDAGFGLVAAADWCGKKALAECLRDVRCLKLAPANLARCIAAGQVNCDAAAYARGVAEGRLGYDPDAGGKCLDAYGTGSCELLPVNCDRLFKGQVPPDGGCFLPEECNPDGFCYPYDLLCPHLCRPYSPRGDTCNGFDRLCKEGDACEYVDAGQLGCIPGRDAGMGCSYYLGCGAGMSCAPGGATDGGVGCVDNRASTGATCHLVYDYYPQCDTQSFCRQPPAPSGGGTRPPGTCEQRVGLGGTCAGSYDNCLPSLRCSGLISTGTCVVRSALGQTCSQSTDCEAQLFCNHFNQKCAALPEEGGDCSAQGSYFTCAVGFWCDYSSPTGEYKCRARRALDAACSYDLSCLSNHCEYGPLDDGGYGQRCVASCAQRADAGP